MLWADYCFPGENLSLEKLRDLPRSHILVCSKHFDPSAYTDSSRKKLIPNAVPINRHMLGPSPSQQQLEFPASSSVTQQCTLTDIDSLWKTNDISLSNAVLAQTVPGPSQQQPEVPEEKPMSYWETFPRRQVLFDAHKFKYESLAQWAARLTRLGEESDYEDIRLLDMLLRDKFVTGLDPGPIKKFFEGRPDIYQLSFKQVLDMAFHVAAEIEREEKARAKALAIQKAAKE